MGRQYALFGSGKTGSKIPELLGAGEDYTFFNSGYRPTADRLAGHDAIICFVPGPVLVDYLDLFLSSRLPLVSGATAIDWPENWNQRLKEQRLSWVWSDNFALGMNIVRSLIELLSTLSSLYQQPNFHIHEIHHVNKLDAPSGTALRWQDWLGQEVSISYDRHNDVVGQHQLTLDTEFEKISIKHDAKDRRIFAHGALWACRQLLDADLPPGLLPLDYLTTTQRQGECYVSNQPL